jgi:hypothetical protein
MIDSRWVPVVLRISVGILAIFVIRWVLGRFRPRKIVAKKSRIKDSADFLCALTNQVSSLMGKPEKEVLKRVFKQLNLHPQKHRSPSDISQGNQHYLFYADPPIRVEFHFGPAGFLYSIVVLGEKSWLAGLHLQNRWYPEFPESNNEWSVTYLVPDYLASDEKKKSYTSQADLLASLTTAPLVKGKLLATANRFKDIFEGRT